MVVGREWCKLVYNYLSLNTKDGNIRMESKEDPLYFLYT